MTARRSRPPRRTSGVGDAIPTARENLEAMIRVAVRLRLSEVLEGLRAAGGDASAVLLDLGPGFSADFPGRPEVLCWTVRRHWDPAQGAWFVTHRDGLSVRDEPGPRGGAGEWERELCGEVSRAVGSHVLWAMRGLDVLGLPPLQDLLDLRRVQEVHES